MHALSPLIHHHAPQWLMRMSQVALAMAIGAGAAVLLAPDGAEPPPMLETNAATAPDTRALAQWFGGPQLRVRVAAHGVIAGEDGTGAALLAVDGSAPRAYRVGQTLAPGVILESVSAKAVSISQDGVEETVALPAIAGGVPHGFVSPASLRP